MALDWIFGPLRVEELLVSYSGALQVRGRAIDLEAVFDAVKVATTGHPGATVSYSVGDLYTKRPVSVEDLPLLGAADRQKLSVLVELPAVAGDSPTPERKVMITFEPGRRTHVRAEGPIPQFGMPEIDKDLRGRVADALTVDGRNLVPWKQLTRHLVVLPALLMLVSWLVLLTTERVPGPAVVLGWTGLVFVASVSAYTDHRLKQLVKDQWPGVLIRAESRTATAARRADNHRDIKVALYTLLGAVIAGLIIWGLTEGVGVS